MGLITSLVIKNTSNGTISDYNYTYQGTAAGNNTVTVFSTARNVTASFGVGNFSIQHGVNGTYGSNISTQVTWVNVSSYPVASLVSSFTVNNSIGYQYPMAVAFTDTSAGNPTTWNYTFNDTYTSTAQNTSHIFPVAGNYLVVMNVTNSTGSYSLSTANINLTTDNDAWLRSWMQFENGTVTDLQGNSWTATSGAGITAVTPKFGVGALSIQANDARITSPSSTVWDRSGVTGELEFWINVTALGDAGKPLIKRSSGGDATTDGWGFYNTNGTANGYSFWYGNAASNHTTPFNIPMNTWTHVVLSRNTSEYWTVYKNGVYQTSYYVDAVTTNPAVPMQIGANGGGSEFQFKLDEFRYSQGSPRFITNFDPPYAMYRGNLYQNYININPNATLMFKSYPSIAGPIFNQTPRNRTVQIQNITNATSITAVMEYNSLQQFEDDIAAYPNKTTYADMQIDQYIDDDVNGLITLKVSRSSGLGISSLFDNRTSLVDVQMAYTNYTSDQYFYEAFVSGNITDGQHYATYPITNFYITPVTIGTWTIFSNFTASPTTAAIGTPIVFTDLSKGEPSGWTSWLWDFGDGGNSNVRNPTYTYGAIGNYTVTLTSSLIANASVTNSTTRIGYINITSTPPPAPVASFTGAPLIVLAGTPVQFTDTSTNTPTSWAWDFGDSTGSSLQNPSHAYSALGLKTVSLTATNPQGSNTSTRTNYINVTKVLPSVSGFNRQDLVMYPQYVLTLNIVDSSGNPIPDAQVLDSNGYNATAPLGVFTYQYPYSVVVFYVTATGYTTASASYIIDSNQTQTIVLSKTVTTTQNANVIFSPRSVAIQVLDANYNPIVNDPVYVNARSSSLPGGLAGAVSYFKTTYGVAESTAQSMLAANTTYYGKTDDYGFIAIQVADIIQYQVVTHDTTGANVTMLFWPSGPYYQIVTDTAAVAGIAAQGRSQANINRNSTFNTTFWEPNTTHSCMGIDVYDSTGQTNNVYAWWKLMDNGTVWWTNSTAIGGYGPINSSKCVQHIPYQQWKWGGITG